MDIYNKYKTKIDAYLLKGHLLKGASQAIQENIKGTVDGLTAEVRDDDSVLVYSLSYEGTELKGKPILKVGTEGEVSELKGRRVTLESVIPDGKSRNLLVSKTGKITVPLMA